MSKTQPLCTDVELNPEDRILDEIEKNSFTALPGNVGHSAHAPKTMHSFLGVFDEEFYNRASKARLLIRISVYTGPAFL